MLSQKKSKIDIVSVVAKANVHLQRHGKDYFALCPFHTEKTPSFSVSPAKQMFHCFGCGAGGDVIEFVQRFHGLGFLDALKFLGIEGNSKPENRTVLRRTARRNYQKQKRKAGQARLLDKYETWVEQYKHRLLDWIEVTDRVFQKLSWDNLLELAELIKQQQVWKYHLWLIMTAGDEEAAYELFCSKTKS